MKRQQPCDTLMLYSLTTAGTKGLANVPSCNADAAVCG